ncbi:MAG: S-adenosylmethionine decarboxylase family protein [Candidatus Poseidoniales archaeon]|jgi:S-adenosylmethionine decarboxylase|tara:strand:+ start:885 stop:1286 length:402 start_codon:yes stop_codon:yes gene_type:complete
MTQLVSHGKHIFLDYTGYSPQDSDDGHWMLQIMRDAVTNSEAKEVHSHVEQFDGITSPPGFAAVVLLDESHVTAHCYSEKGWLAIDCFTCGPCYPDTIVDQIHMALERVMPNLKLIKKSSHDRFLHQQENTEE